MPIFTLIGRLSDGLPLAASMTSPSNPEVQDYERQAKTLLKNTARKHGHDADAMLTTPAAQQPYVTAEAGPKFNFHYVNDSGVCFLTLTERSYPRRLAYDYLDELRKEFLAIHREQVSSATRPYEFIRFDAYIQKTRKLYSDSRTQRNLDKLNADLKDVYSIMTKNINDVVTRGEVLSNVTEKSTRLGYESKKYAAQAAHANRMRLVRQYAPIGIVLLVVLLLLWLFGIRRR